MGNSVVCLSDKLNGKCLDDVLSKLHSEYREMMEIETEEMTEGFERAIMVVFNMRGELI